MVDHRTPRLFVNAPLQHDAVIALDSEQTHYLKNVMRLQSGDALRVFNGHDGEWHGAIDATSKRDLIIKIAEQLKPQKTEPDLWLCCAPIKKSHFDYMIEKATELGISELHPLLTARTQVREVNSERVQAMMVEAAEQSERLSIPKIEKPVTLKDLVAHWPQDRLLVVCAEAGDAKPVAEAFKQLKPTKKAAIVTGPEGGFAEDEFKLLRQVKDVIFIRLGPRILRADTAAIAALTCWQALQGDWNT